MNSSENDLLYEAKMKSKSTCQKQIGIPTMMASMMNLVMYSKNFSKQTVMMVMNLMGFRYAHGAGLIFNIDDVSLILNENIINTTTCTATPTFIDK